MNGNTITLGFVGSMWAGLFIWMFWTVHKQHQKEKEFKKTWTTHRKFMEQYPPIKPVVLEWRGHWESENRANGSAKSSLRLTAKGHGAALEFQIKTASDRETQEVGVIRGTSSLYLPKSWTVA